MKVHGKILGGDVQNKELPADATVKDLRQAMGLSDDYAAQDASKEPLSDGEQLAEGDFITFSQSVKGGRAA